MDEQKNQESVILLVQAMMEDARLLKDESEALMAISRRYRERVSEEVPKISDGTSRIPLPYISKWSEQSGRYSSAMLNLSKQALERTREAAGLLKPLGFDFPEVEDKTGSISLDTDVTLEADRMVDEYREDRAGRDLDATADLMKKMLETLVSRADGET